MKSWSSSHYFTLFYVEYSQLLYERHPKMVSYVSLISLLNKASKPLIRFQNFIFHWLAHYVAKSVQHPMHGARKIPIKLVCTPCVRRFNLEITLIYWVSHKGITLPLVLTFYKLFILNWVVKCFLVSFIHAHWFLQSTYNLHKNEK